MEFICDSISIHALREEGDKNPLSVVYLGCHFYPRPPRGGRQTENALSIGGNYISIHALREEGDPEHAETAV